MGLGKLITDRSIEIGASVGDDNRGMLHVLSKQIGQNVPTHDAWAVQYPNDTTVVFQFYQGGLAGTLVKTLTVTFSDSCKKHVTSGVWT